MSEQSNVIVEQHHQEQIEETPQEEVILDQQEVETPEDPMSSRFAALARREKMLHEKERQFKASLEERERSFKEREAKYSGWEDADAALNEDPLAWLEGKGWNYSKLTDKALGIQAEEQEYDPKSEIQKLREELAKRDEDEKTRMEEKQTTEQQAVQEASLNEYRVQIQNIVESDQDKYELINLKGAQEDILEVAIEYYQTHQKVISAEEAADLVEKYLEEEAATYLKATKFTNREEKQQPLQDTSFENKPTPSPSKTLTSNNTAGNNPMQTQTHRRNLSEEESKKEAAKLLKWN